MKLVKISQGGRNAEGFLEGKDVHVWSEWRAGPAAEAPFELSRMDLDQARAARAATREVVARSAVRLELPLDVRAKVISIGVNFIEHLAEANRARPQQPALFFKVHDAIVGPEDVLRSPRVSEQFDFEGEMCFVIGRSARHVDQASARDHILGYSCFMDGSVRDFQNHSASAGKNFAQSSALGPWIVTADALPDIRTARMETHVSGEKLQETTLDQMLFNEEQVIAYCSGWTELRPGDVITMGTPSGVGLFRDPQRWLVPGDVVDVTIDGVGTLSNRVEPE